jgi:hypothetical protein
MKLLLLLLITVFLISLPAIAFDIHELNGQYVLNTCQGQLLKLNGLIKGDLPVSSAKYFIRAYGYNSSNGRDLYAVELTQMEGGKVVQRFVIDEINDKTLDQNFDNINYYEGHKITGNGVLFDNRITDKNAGKVTDKEFLRLKLKNKYLSLEYHGLGTYGDSNASPEARDLMAEFEKVPCDEPLYCH